MKYLTLIALLFICLINNAQATYSKSIISTECWSENPVIATATQQNALAVYKNYVYTAYYNTDRYLCVSRSDNYGQGNWKTVVLSHRYEMRDGIYDSHNTPNIAISPKDKRIHLSFDLHFHDLRYIISGENLAVASDNDFVAAGFSEVRDYITSNQTTVTSVTYPRFIVGLDSTLLFSYRSDGASGNANSYLTSYKNDGYWNTPTKIVDGKTGTYTGVLTDIATRCAYYNDFVYKGGVLYLTWTWRETPDGATNHDVMFAYSEDNGVTWKNTNDQPLSLPMHLNSTDLKVQTVAQNTGLSNHNGCAVDASNNVHALMRMGTGYKHFYRLGTQWQSKDVSTGESVGDRPKLYCGDMTNTLYLVLRRTSTISLFTSSSVDDWSTWTKLESINDSYMSTCNSFISSDGKTLRTMAVTSDNELHLITWSLNTPLAEEATSLSFKNLTDNQVIEYGTDLSIEANVGSALTEVSLWSGSTKIGTKTEPPYVWSEHSILKDMTEASYSFKLVAKDMNNQEVLSELSITTSEPSENTFTGEAVYTIYNPNKDKWMGYNVATNDALVTDDGLEDINKFEVVANGEKFNIYTGDFQKVLIINSALGYSAMLADPTAEVLASGDAQFTFAEISSGAELYLISSGANYKLNVKSDASDIGRGTSELANYQWQITRIADVVTSIEQGSSNSDKVTIYPNPASSVIYFKGVQVKIAKVYTLSGQVINNYAVDSNQVDVSQLKRGMYLLQAVDNQGNISTKRLMIE